MIRAFRLRPAAIDTLGIFSISGEMVPTNQNLKNKNTGFLSLLLPDWSIFLISLWKKDKLAILFFFQILICRDHFP